MRPTRLRAPMVCALQPVVVLAALSVPACRDAAPIHSTPARGDAAAPDHHRASRVGPADRMTKSARVIRGSPADAAVPENPRALLRLALQRCERDIQDYSCTFTRQERVRGRLLALQTMEVLCREDPRSVYMTWVGNARRVRRALYIEGQRVDDHGAELMLIEPAGALARALVGALWKPVNGPEARRSGRYTLDQFGFKEILRRIERTNVRAAARGDLELTRGREAAFGSRPTIVLVRYLPYSGEGGEYPDARLDIQLDREWLVPVSLRSYADRAGTNLLGAYTFTRIKINRHLTDSTFRF